MPALIKVTSRPTFRDLNNQKFAPATKKLIEHKRDMMRKLGRRYVALAQEEAPKKTGKFAKGIRFQSFAAGDNVGFKVTTPQPLGTFITEGTKAHSITPKGPGYPLAFYWEKMGKMWYTYHVSHPGTKANPFHKRAMSRWLPEAEMDLRRISTRWATEVSS